MTFQTAQEAERKFRKIMARTYLNQNRLEDALEIYAAILRSDPEDGDALLVLGNLYLAAGDASTAGALYTRALALNPKDLALQRQCALAQSEGATGSGESEPAGEAAVARLIEKLTGKTAPMPDAELEKAAALLDRIVHSDNPAEMVALHLDEIDDLLPALIELNIRQAESDGRPDLASGLRNLQQNVTLQKEAEKAENAEVIVESPSFTFKGSVLLLTADPEHPNARVSLAAACLASHGCQVTIDGAFDPAADARPDVVISYNPHTQPRLLESLASLAAADVPLIVDLDSDFENMPISHPLYPLTGLNTPQRARAFTASLLLSGLVTVNSPRLAEIIHSAGHPVQLVPDMWNRKNALWTRLPGTRPIANIGWISGPSQLEDLASIRRVVLRVLRELPNTRMVVVGDLNAYRLFDTLPEQRRLFLPAVPEDEKPYLLSQIDILLLPLRNQPFFQATSDLPLVEAGVKGIPWIASPMPAFRDWHEGGMLADSLEEWHQALRQLALDADLRATLGKTGGVAAVRREMSRSGRHWMEAIQQAVSIPHPTQTRMPA